MASFRTVQFSSTPEGQRDKARTLKVYSESGWTMVSETLEPGKTDRGRQSPGVITVTFRSEKEDVPDAVNLSMYDSLLFAAAKVVVESRQVKPGIIQETLKIGYGRASRLIDELEKTGVVAKKGRTAELVDRTVADLERRFGSQPR